MTAGPIARIRISLNDIEPEIWREIDVPISMSLKGLHDVIQVVFGLADYHLHEFRVGDKLYGIPAPDGEDYGRKVLQDKLIRIGALIAKGYDRFANAWPEPCLRYLSNRSAFNWSTKTTCTTHRHGRCLLVCIDFPELCSASRASTVCVVTPT